MGRKRKIRPPVKTHGGKYYLANWIISHFPNDHQELVYVEPYCGGANVFLNKERSIEECINDIDLSIIQIFRALRDEPGEFISRLKRVNYTERVFKRCQNKVGPFEDYISHGLNEFILRRMSRGGLKKNFGWSKRTRGGKPGDLNAWETILEELPRISKRLKNVYILNKSAVEIIKAFNDEESFVYCDPPYLLSTRTATDVYDYEMDIDDHSKLAKVLIAYKGKAMISGYASKLYQRLYKDWRCKRKRIANHASQKKTKGYKMECIWMNY